jgi:membrane fusion protein (multidrug efflux system)
MNNIRTTDLNGFQVDTILKLLFPLRSVVLNIPSHDRFPKIGNRKRRALTSFIACVFLCACGSKEPPVKEEVKGQLVKTFVLQDSQAENTVALPGELIAFQEVDIYAKVNSFVKEVPVDRGSEVKKGDLLLLLDAPEYESQMAEAASKLKTREAILKSSAATYSRLYETSKTPGTVSPNDLDLALSKMMSDSAEVSSARSSYKAAMDIKDYLTVRAAFDGMITERNIHPGAYVGPSGKGSDKPLLKLKQENVLRLTVAVPEVFTSSLHLGDQVRFTVKSYPNEQFTAKVSRLAGNIETTIRSELIEMDVINKDKKLLSGMYAQVELNTKRDSKSFLVPATCVVASTEGVFVIRVENGKAKRIKVNKGNMNGVNVEAYGDLKNGDSLVTEASENIRGGDIIKSK